MTTIRICTPQDIPEVVALFGRVYPAHRWRSQADCEAYFREVLFEHPWRDPALPSLVAEEVGAIVGFQAIAPRPMRFQGRMLRAAVTTQFMIDPARRRSLIALQLLQACLSGPQELSFADGSNDDSARICRGAGGDVALLYSLHWTRPLRPARYAVSLLRQRNALSRPAAIAAGPLCALADGVAARLRPNRFLGEDSAEDEGDLDTVTMLAHLPEMMRGASLQPVYDARSLDWLLEQAARKTRHGRLRARCVRDGAGRVLGWYLYYLRPGDVSEVLQLAARGGAYDTVLRRLLADGWRHGALAMNGRIDPQHVAELSARHCWIRRQGTWTLVHSRNPAILAAIHRGEAAISRLEGEWWLRFHGEAQPGRGAPAHGDAKLAATLHEHPA